jgi:hypothetical protein
MPVFSIALSCLLATALVVEEQPQLDRPAFLASRSAAQHAPVSIGAGPPQHPASAASVFASNVSSYLSRIIEIR